MVVVITMRMLGRIFTNIARPCARIGWIIGKKGWITAKTRVQTGRGIAKIDGRVAQEQQAVVPWAVQLEHHELLEHHEPVAPGGASF